MTSKLNIPKISKVNEMPEGIRGLVGRKMFKNVKFMGEEIKIQKLSVAQVLEIQAKAKEVEKDEKEGFNVLKTVVRAGTVDAEDLSDEDFDNLPLDELSKLSSAIMEHSGIGEKSGK